MQLYFENPQFVSTTSTPPRLKIVFNNTSLININGDKLDLNLELSKSVPSQMEISLGEKIDGAANFAANTAKTFFAGSFILNLFFIGGLSQLLNMI